MDRPRSLLTDPDVLDMKGKPFITLNLKDKMVQNNRLPGPVLTEPTATYLDGTNFLCQSEDGEVSGRKRKTSQPNTKRD
ncbi:hypothetical protein LSH36_155g00014 [Paralvinella palmiformis]|uniref:Uncharacterized protein n=1 Tax=Paralvinella palmiformis TaxID=53620 RepID=A0AAD9N8T5_9ANNE|nr:hypothetical protein LSH36_155g00014 [Paralvinella palmiformis]